MRSRNFLYGLLILAGTSPATAQTIQLPSFNVFSVDTTVLVPDSGPAPLASTRRAASSSNSFGGLPRQRGMASDLQMTGAGVIAQVHDAQAADEALRRMAPRKVVVETNAPVLKTAAANSGAANVKLASVEELRRQRDAQAKAEQDEVRSIFERARQAQAADKLSVAEVYYRSAARKATGPLRQEILAAWRSMKTPAAAARRAPISAASARDR